MNNETKTPQVYAAISAVASDLAMIGIAKERKNAQQGYNFRGIDEVLNALAPLLAKHRLVIAPRIVSRDATERPSKSGGVTFSIVVRAEFDFIAAADGSVHTITTYGEAMDSGDKATNKAMSAAYKYAAFLTFCIPLEAMIAEDADARTPDPAPRTQAKPATTTAPSAPTDLEDCRAKTKAFVAAEGLPVTQDEITAADTVDKLRALCRRKKPAAPETTDFGKEPA